MFRYEVKKGDVSFHAAVKRRIIPDNVTLAVSTWSIILSVFVVGKACCVSTGLSSQEPALITIQAKDVIYA